MNTFRYVVRKQWKRLKRYIHHTYLRIRGKHDELEEILVIEMRNKKSLANVYSYILEKAKEREAIAHVVEDKQ